MSGSWSFLRRESKTAPAEAINCARRILGNNGAYLGVIGVNISFQQIKNHVLEMNLTGGSYGFLINDALDIIAYPDSSILLNAWILTLAASQGEYYREPYDMALILIILGVTLAIALIFMLMRLDAAKKKSDEISRQKNMQLIEMEKMLEVDERVKIIYDSTPLASAMFNEEGIAIDCNEAALKMFELRDKQEFIDRFRDLHPKYQPDGKLSLEEIPKNFYKTLEEGQLKFEWMYQLPSGELMPGEVTLIRVVYKGEQMMVGYYRDLRELKAAIAEMREADERVKIIFDSTPIACAMVTTNQKVLDCNMMAVNMFGFRDKEEYIERYWELFPEYQPCGRRSLDLVPEYIARAVKEGQFTFEWQHKLLDGTPLPVEVTLACAMYNGEQVIVRYTRDLSEFKAMLNEIEERTAQLEAVQLELEAALNSAKVANQAKSSFLANMSHEIRTPMNAILGITEILVQNETLPGDIMEGLVKIYNSCDMLLGIINDILDLSKIEAGKLDIIPAAYEVASLVNDSVQLNVMRIGSKPIEFVLQIDENIPSKLIGDELRIKQVLNNLLSNAFKYTDCGKVTLSVAFAQEKEIDDIVLIINVEDTGYGMTPKQVETLFDEYTRFNSGINRVIEGTGLGMSITQHLVYLMGGKIFLESEPGKGSLFTVRLPQKKVNAEVLGRQLAENLRQFQLNYMADKRKVQITRDPMPYGKILIVDDVETNIYVAAGLMKLYKLQIDTATGGQEAIDKIKNGNVYDIVFMDHMMPEMDGIETTKHLRDLGYTNPIVALTANAVAKQADVFLQNGFDDFIAKPIDIRQLNTVLNKLVRDRQPPDVIEAAKWEKISENRAAAAEPEADTLLAASFMRDARKAVAALAKLCKDEGFEDESQLNKFTVVVHGMKSALANIGEAELAQSAQRLEFMGRGQNVEQIEASVPAFLKELQTLLKKLESKQQQDSTDEDTDYLYEKLLAVKKMCGEYDREGATHILVEMKRKKCSKDTREVLERIMKQVLHSDFEEAADTAAEYAKGIVRVSNKKITGLDMARGLERYYKDEKMYLKILRSYSKNLSVMLNTLETVSKDSLSDYEVAVHGIRGASNDVFANQIGKDAAKLEEAAKSGDIDYIYKRNPAFIEAVKELVNNLNNMFSDIDAENQKPKKDKPGGEALSKLLTACEAYDLDGVNAAMEEIDGYVYESGGDLVEWLRDKVYLMDFPQIVQKLSE